MTACPITVTVTAAPSQPATTPGIITTTTTILGGLTQMYSLGMQLIVRVVYTNTGGSARAFKPELDVNGTLVPDSVTAPNSVVRTLSPGASITVQYNFPVTGSGVFIICPTPNE